jgi:hypothetical protein
MGKQTWIKLDDNWTPLSNIWEKVSGTWKEKVISFIRVGGDWKQCMLYTHDDWFLPSKDELTAMYTELYLYNLGDLGHQYWSSTEHNNLEARLRNFETGEGPVGKNNVAYVRACRSFTSTKSYNLRDDGPAGGLIFWKSGDNYLECAPTDQSISHVWSNINNVLIGTTSADIGEGSNNTYEIMAQNYHTDSAAKLCVDTIL